MSPWRTATFSCQSWIAIGITAICSSNFCFLGTGCWRVLRAFLPSVYVIERKKKMWRRAAQLWKRKPPTWVGTSQIKLGSHCRVCSWMSNTYLLVSETRNERNATIAAVMVARASGRQCLCSIASAADCYNAWSIIGTVSSVRIGKFWAKSKRKTQGSTPKFTIRRKIGESLIVKVK